jgi:hypothetical protein
VCPPPRSRRLRLLLTPCGLYLGLGRGPGELEHQDGAAGEENEREGDHKQQAGHHVIERPVLQATLTRVAVRFDAENEGRHPEDGVNEAHSEAQVDRGARPENIKIY